MGNLRIQAILTPLGKEKLGWVVASLLYFVLCNV